jgi:phosphoenolpyruvate phosphomutase
MRETCRQVWEDESVREVEGRVASVQEIFRLVGNAELEEAERRYLPGRATASAVVLAATRGDLGELTCDQPKCMIDVRGQSLLMRLVSLLSDTLSMVATPFNAIASLRKPRTTVMERMPLPTPAKSTRWLARAIASTVRQSLCMATSCSAAIFSTGRWQRMVKLSLRSMLSALWLARARHCVTSLRPTDGFPAIISTMRRSGYAPSLRICRWRKAAANGSVWSASPPRARHGCVRSWTSSKPKGKLDGMDMPMLITRLAAKHPVFVHYIKGHWLDVDTLDDLSNARNFT